MNRIITIIFVAASFLLFSQNVLAEEIKPKKMIGQYMTTFNPSNKPRTHNITQAVIRLHGIIVKPGQEISFDKILGPRSIEHGFKKAGSYASAMVVQSIGGGICQVASTLSGAVHKANLEILEQRKHSLPVSYCPPEVEATIASGLKDFRFKNNTKNTLYIKALGRTDRIYVEIWRL